MKERGMEEGGSKRGSKGWREEKGRGEVERKESIIDSYVAELLYIHIHIYVYHADMAVAIPSRPKSD